MQPAHRHFPKTHVTTGGYTTIELVVGVVVVGLLISIVGPTLAGSWDGEQVRSAKVKFTGLHAKARAVAIQRSNPTTLEISGSRLVIRSSHPVSGATDTVGTILDLYNQFGVSVAASRDSLVFDTMGVGTEDSNTHVVLSRNGVSDTLWLSRSGRLYP